MNGEAGLTAGPDALPFNDTPPQYGHVNLEALNVAVDMALDLEDRLVAASLWELRRDVAGIREAIEDALP